MEGNISRVIRVYTSESGLKPVGLWFVGGRGVDQQGHHSGEARQHDVFVLDRISGKGQRIERGG